MVSPADTETPHPLSGATYAPGVLCSNCASAATSGGRLVCGKTGERLAADQSTSSYPGCVLFVRSGTAKTKRRR